MKNLFPKLILLVLILGSGYYLLQQQGIISAPSLNQQSTLPISGEVKGSSDSLTAQAGTLSERAQEVGQHIGNVLGTYVQPASAPDNETNSSSTKPPLHEQAFEYTRYLYCQQVVKDYEQQYSTAE